VAANNSVLRDVPLPFSMPSPFSLFAAFAAL
jgi:hypothetical protein